MRILSKHLALVLAVLFLSPVGVIGKKKKNKNSGYEIMKQVRDQSRIHKTQRSEVFMVIYDKKGSKRERYFNHLKKQKNKKNSSMIKFFRPASVKGTSLRNVSLDDEDDTEQWIYLPAFRSVKKLSSKDKGNSFMGSDFTNSDIAGRNLSQDEHKLLKEDSKHYYIGSKPKDKKDPYSKLELKIHKKFMIPIQVKFYNKKKKEFKIMKNLKLKKIKGMYVVIESEMKNLKKGGKTTLKVSNIKVGINISDTDVGIKGLKK